MNNRVELDEKKNGDGAKSERGRDGGEIKSRKDEGCIKRKLRKHRQETLR